MGRTATRRAAGVQRVNERNREREREKGGSDASVVPVGDGHRGGL